jgi:hypothetical protein
VRLHGLGIFDWTKKLLTGGAALVAVGSNPIDVTPSNARLFPEWSPPKTSQLSTHAAPSVGWIDVQNRAKVLPNRTEEEFVASVMAAATKLPHGGLLLFDWDQTVVDVHGEVRDGFHAVLEQLRSERPDLEIGVLTSRREAHMHDVRATCQWLKLDGPILDREDMDAEDHRVDWRELKRISGLDKKDVASTLESGGTPNKALYVAEAYRGRLESVHLFDDGESGRVGEILHLATHTVPPDSTH